METTAVGKFLMIIGFIAIIGGVLFYFSGSIPFLRHIGRLPGDMSWRGEGWQIHFPLATSLILSVVLTLLFWFFSWIQSRGGR